MASNVIIPLGLDKENLDKKFLFVIERHGSHSCFMLSSLIVLGFQSDAAIYLVSFHYQEKHYEKICARLGINLQVEKDKERFIGWYPTIDKRKSMGDMKDATNSNSIGMEGILKNMFFRLKDDITKLKNKNSRIFIIIDDISDLLLTECEVRNIILFSQSCRSLLRDGITLVMGTHLSKEDKQQQILFEIFRRLADISIEVHGFEAMWTFNGSLRIVRKKINSGFPKHDSDFHHFKITENRIALFSPGFMF